MFCRDSFTKLMRKIDAAVKHKYVNKKCKSKIKFKLQFGPIEINEFYV